MWLAGSSRLPESDGCHNLLAFLPRKENVLIKAAAAEVAGDESYQLDAPAAPAGSHRTRRDRVAGPRLPPRMLSVHAVVALALPAVEAFDLAIPAQVFADPGLPKRYEFTVCSPAAGLVRSTTGFSVQAERGLDALAVADTVVVPGYLPLGDPGERVCSALRQAADHINNQI